MVELIPSPRRVCWRGLFLTALLLFVVGCARYKPHTYTFLNERLVEASTEQVTERVVQWCAANGWAVSNNTGGVISATSDLTTWARAYDCGEHADGPFISREGTLSVVVTAAGGTAGSTRVQVVFRATPLRGTMAVACASTGAIEMAVLDAAAR